MSLISIKYTLSITSNLSKKTMFTDENYQVTPYEVQQAYVQPTSNTKRVTKQVAKVTQNNSAQYGKTYRSLPGTEASQQEFHKRQLVAIKKATDKTEVPPKEKHVRFLLLGCSFEKRAKK